MGLRFLVPVVVRRCFLVPALAACLHPAAALAQPEQPKDGTPAQPEQPKDGTPAQPEQPKDGTPADAAEPACERPLEAAQGIDLAAAVGEEKRLAGCVQRAQSKKDELEQEARRLDPKAANFAKAALDAATAGQKLVKLKKRHELAKQLVVQAQKQAELKNARKQLTTAKAQRVCAETKAKEGELELADDAIAKARAATQRAADVAAELTKRNEALRAAIAREEGQQEELVRQATEVDQRLGATPAPEDQARLEATRAVLEARIEASREAQGVLQELASSTTKTEDALKQEVKQSEDENGKLTDQKLKRIALKNGDNLSYGVTLAAVRLRVSRDPNQEARLRDYKPEAEFVPSLLGLRIVYEPKAGPWRIDTSGDALQLMSIEFALYLEKSEGTSLESLSAGVGLTFMEGLLGIGLAFDVYREMDVKGGEVKTGIMPWALSRTGEVTAENVAVMVTLGLESVFSALTGSTDTAEDGESP